MPYFYNLKETYYLGLSIVSKALVWNAAVWPRRYRASIAQTDDMLSDNILITASATVSGDVYRRAGISGNLLLCLLCVSVLSGCTLFENTKSAPPPEADTAPPKLEPLPSAKPVLPASKRDIEFAQTTLNNLGYKLGRVDGIWGPKSAEAIRRFEKNYGLESADGFLSELNLFMLEKISNTSRHAVAENAQQTNPKKFGISAKLDESIPLSTAPQLVFIDKPYAILAKPNPFSEQLALLPVGTGIYIISLQDGWYEVESEDKDYGFIQAD